MRPYSISYRANPQEQLELAKKESTKQRVAKPSVTPGAKLLQSLPVTRGNELLPK